MFCFGFLRIFEEKSQKGANIKFGHRAPTPQCGMPSPRRGQGAQKGTPRVRRGVDTVHNEEIFWILFRKSRIRTPIV